MLYALSAILHLQLTESGEKTMDVISVSQALQIAGRAGRFGTKWETGHVTTFKQEEIKVTHSYIYYVINVINIT